MVQISCNITSVRRKKLHEGPEAEVGKVMTKEREGEEMRRPRCRQDDNMQIDLTEIQMYQEMYTHFGCS
jgi:hypothetical protein